VRQDWIIKEWGRTPTHVMQGFNRMVPGADVTALLLVPARSSFTPLSEQVKVRDTIPGAQIAVIDGRGHEIDGDEPEACTTALLRFLRSLEPAETPKSPEGREDGEETSPLCLFALAHYCFPYFPALSSLIPPT
jgi:hypothetical protein